MIEILYTEYDGKNMYEFFRFFMNFVDTFQKKYISGCQIMHGLAEAHASACNRATLGVFLQVSHSIVGCTGGKRSHKYPVAAWPHRIFFLLCNRFFFVYVVSFKATPVLYCRCLSYFLFVCLIVYSSLRRCRLGTLGCLLRPKEWPTLPPSL
jgi:hypothetical protein